MTAFIPKWIRNSGREWATALVGATFFSIEARDMYEKHQWEKVTPGSQAYSGLRTGDIVLISNRWWALDRWSHKLYSLLCKLVMKTSWDDCGVVFVDPDYPEEPRVLIVEYDHVTCDRIRDFLDRRHPRGMAVRQIIGPIPQVHPLVADLTNYNTATTTEDKKQQEEKEKEEIKAAKAKSNNNSSNKRDSFASSSNLTAAQIGYKKVKPLVDDLVVSFDTNPISTQHLPHHHLQHHGTPSATTSAASGTTGGEEQEQHQEQQEEQQQQVAKRVPTPFAVCRAAYQKESERAQYRWAVESSELAFEIRQKMYDGTASDAAIEKMRDDLNSRYMMTQMYEQNLGPDPEKPYKKLTNASLVAETLQELGLLIKPHPLAYRYTAVDFAWRVPLINANLTNPKMIFND